jgi:hypothetical protein
MTTRERMVAIDPDEASATEEYPNNIRPGESDYDETAPIWGVWEAGVGRRRMASMAGAPWGRSA